MQTTQQLMPVPFYEDTVGLVGKDNEPLVSMKPIVIIWGWTGKANTRKFRIGSVQLWWKSPQLEVMANDTR